MKFDQLPFDQFEILGVSRSDLLKLPPRTLNALLSGQRTSLMRFPNVELPGGVGPATLDAKLSIELKEDGSPTLKVHPIRNQAENVFKLSKEEITHLQQDETNFIERTIKDRGKPKEMLITLDKTVNEFVAINKAKVRAPESINDIALTEDQKKAFREGKTITVGGEGFRLNPNSEIGITTTTGDDNKIKKLHFKVDVLAGVGRAKGQPTTYRHSTYSSRELAIDLALIASGAGTIVLLEHLANIAFTTAADRIKQNNKAQNLSDPRYWDAIKEATREIRRLPEPLGREGDTVESIINRHLEAIGILHPKTSQAENLTVSYSTKPDGFVPQIKVKAGDLERLHQQAQKNAEQGKPFAVIGNENGEARMYYYTTQEAASKRVKALTLGNKISSDFPIVQAADLAMAFKKELNQPSELKNGLVALSITASSEKEITPLTKKLKMNQKI